MGGNHSRDNQRNNQPQPVEARHRHSTDNIIRGSLILARHDRKCPICHKMQRADEYELHVVCCLTKPKLDYNVQILEKNDGECIICYEELDPGQEIARLPCLCIYHIQCIKDWFKVKEECPKHPAD